MISLAVAGCGQGDLLGDSISGGGSPGPAANRAPTINGNPPSTVRVNEAYDFRPSAFDADGDALRFQIVGKPAWAAFDANTGRLYGTPPSGTSGTFGGVQIAVSDGQATGTLPAFSILVVTSIPATGNSAVLNWTRPTLYEDGKPLADLAGYRVYYGTSTAQYSKTIEITDPATTSTTIPALSSGTWYFAISSVNTAGVESRKGGPVALTIG